MSVKQFVVIPLALSVLSGSMLLAQSAQPQPSAPATAQTPQTPTAQFEARADVVLVDVTVVSDKGEPVTGLTAADFQLTVNGTPRAVHTVQFITSMGTKAPDNSRMADVSSNDGASTGRLLLFVVDENYLRAGSGRAVLATAERVMNGLLPGDLVGLARLPTGRGGVEFTTDRNRIRRALSVTMGAQPSRLTEQVRLSEASAYENNDQNVWQQVIERECGSSTGFARESCIQGLVAQAKFLLTDATMRTRLSISGFEQLARRLAPLRSPVNIVLISEGLFLGRDRMDLTNLARLAASARISFFVVQPDESLFDMGNTPKTVGGLPEEWVLAEGLEELAGLTRGSYHRVVTSGSGVFDRISRELSGYYLLSFEPTDADRTSRDRRIKVEVRRKGLTVRARSTYAIDDPAAAAAAAALPPEEQIKGLLSAPLPTAGLPIRVTSYSIANPQDSRVRVIISAEMGEAATDAVDWPVGMIVIDNKTDKIVVDNLRTMKLAPASERTPTPRLMLTSVVLEPGEYTLRLAAVTPGGPSGSVHHTIDARLSPIAGDGVRASELILTSAVEPGAAPRPIPSSIVFTEAMAAILDLSGSDTKRLASSRVTVQIAESETGPALVSTEAQIQTRDDAQRTFVAALKLGVLPPGEYVARAVVALPGQADAHVTRSFRLAPVATATDDSPIALRVAGDEAPAPLPIARIVAPVARFTVDDVLAPAVVRGFIDDLQLSHPVSATSSAVVRQAREGTFVLTPSDASHPTSDEPMLAFIRGLAQLQKKQYAQAAAWFQLTLKSASDFLGAAFYLGAVHAANGRDADAVGAWQLSLLNGGTAVYPMLVDATLRIGDAQGALELIAEAPDAWPSDEARLRRVATAQAMLGQFEPALQTINALLTRRPDDLDLLFVAIQVMYRQHLARPLAPADRSRFDDYTRKYLDGKGPDAALVETWRRYVLR